MPASAHMTIEFIERHLTEIVRMVSFQLVNNAAVSFPPGNGVYTSLMKILDESQTPYMVISADNRGVKMFSIEEKILEAIHANKVVVIDGCDAPWRAASSNMRDVLRTAVKQYSGVITLWQNVNSMPHIDGKWVFLQHDYLFSCKELSF